MTSNGELLLAGNLSSYFACVIKLHLARNIIWRTAEGLRSLLGRRRRQHGYSIKSTLDARSAGLVVVRQ